MRIKDIPWYNQPYSRLKQDKELNDAELLAIILERGKFSENAIDMSNRLLKKYNFNKLKNLNLIELRKELGEIKALKIKALFEIYKKTKRLDRFGFKPVIESPKDVYNHFVDLLKDKKKEYLYSLILDSKNRIIKAELISIGTLNSTLIHPREIFKEAIKCSANSIILVHNHPTKDTTPSHEDIKITHKIKDAGELLGIKVIDHIIIGNGYKSI